MKGGLCLIYTSLLTISVLSSCALFILVVSEVGEPLNQDVDLSGLHNVSKKESNSETAEPDYQENPDEYVEEKLERPSPPEIEHEPDDQEMIFADALSLNSVTTDGLPETGQPPVLISLADSTKLELKSPEDLLFVNDSEQHNDTKTFTLIDDGDTIEDNTNKDAEPNKETIESHLVFKAKPMHEVRQLEDSFQSTTPTPLDVQSTESQLDIGEEIENIPVKPQTPQEDIPSFSEWAQKQLAEAEKDTVLNHSSQPSHSNTNLSNKNNKIRSKNYASLACGAKVVAVNPEAASPSAILSPNRDEYMLNTCNSRIWFVVELCEAVQAQKIELANFELFSSTPKDIAVYFSDRFPTRDWTSVGQFTAKDMRDVQSFDLYPHLFGKFIKVEMNSHYGSEHYCPISLFKVYGTSEFEVLEKESSQHPAHIDDEDDEIIDIPDLPAVETEPSKNLFGSARDAVMSIMKKAAQALVKSEVPKNVSSEHNDTSVDKMYKRCCSPSHIIVCDNCSESLYNEVFELISCSSDKLSNLVRQVFLRDTLKCSGICQQFGLDFKSTKTIEFSDERVSYMNALFQKKYLAALCNMLAIKEKKVVLNSSFETETDVTTNITIDETPQNLSSELIQEQESVADILNTSSFDNDNRPAEENDDATELSNEVNNNTEEMEKDDKEKEKPEVNIPEPTQVEEKSASDSDDFKVMPEVDNPAEVKIDVETKDTSIKTDIKNGKIENIEKSKETPINADEVKEAIQTEPLNDGDSFLSDFDQMAVDPTPAGTQTSSSGPGQTQAALKESVFLRLSNRVKTLERNMSLSGQYLEELSRRYKKQVEEMQKTFEKTIAQMTEERRKSNDRDQKYLEQMSLMQDQISQLSAGMKVLMEERDSWFGTMTVLKFIFYQIIVVVVIFYYISTKRKLEPILVPVPKKIRKKDNRLRRKSVEGVSGHATPSAKKRRPSEEAMVIARQSTEEGSMEVDEGEWQVARKNRRRKTSIIHRNLENNSKASWTRQDSIGKLQENPIPLDEEEYFAPVSEPKEFNEHAPGPPKKEMQKNGSFFNNLTMKTRRLSSPAFLRTLSRQSSRSTPSPVVRKIEPFINGTVRKKAGSESPTNSLWSASTEISQSGAENGNGNTKKKKSLKTILKKVF